MSWQEIAVIAATLTVLWGLLFRSGPRCGRCGSRLFIKNPLPGLYHCTWCLDGMHNRHTIVTRDRSWRL